MSSIIKVEKLSFEYANTCEKVFDDVSFGIPENKITLIIGQSGCGKSTLIQCLGGIIPNSIEGTLNGKIFYKNKDITGIKPENIFTEIGLVFQNPESQFCTFTVKDEIAFGLENIRLPRCEMEKKIDDVLDILNISNLKNRVLNSLSGGEKQKVAIASVLVLNPACIIFDEPTANLDPKSSEEIFELIKNLRDKEKKTIIIIEHKLDKIMEVADYLIQFDKNSNRIKHGETEKIISEIYESNKEIPECFPSIMHISKKLNILDKEIKYFYKENDAVKAIVSMKYTSVSKDTIPLLSQEKKKDKIKLQNVDFAYKKNEYVLKNVNFEVYEGEFIAILGTNGAGKSTLSKIIMGLLKNYSGNVFVDNKNLRSYDKRDLTSKIGLVFQNPEHQFVENSVIDELAYSLKANKVDNKNIISKVEKFLNEFNLTHLKDYSPYLISQGEKRRLSVASMLITGQEILILDEPTFGQDKENTIELMEYMKRLNSMGITIIIITHDIEVASTYCDKAVVFDSGEVIYKGSIRKLFLKEDIIKKANLNVPLVSRLCSEVRKVDKDFPMFSHIKELYDFIDEESNI